MSETLSDNDSPNTTTDLNSRFPTETNGAGYAWGGTAWRIVEHHLEAVKKDTEGSIIALDACSSLPIYAAILRSNHQKDSLISAKNLALNSLANTIQIFNTKTAELPSLQKLPLEALKKFKAELSPVHGASRSILTAIVQDIIDSPLESFDNTNSSEELTAYILDKMKKSKNSYVSTYELKGLVGNGGWEILQSKDENTTFDKLLEKLIPDKVLKEDISQDLATYIAERIHTHLRTFKVITLDWEEPEIIKKRAEASFPIWYQDTEFFQRAADLTGNHIRGDVLNLPLAAESVSLFTSLEGWPFYFQGVSLDEHLRFAENLVNILKPGGRAVFFPWAMFYDQDEDEKEQNNEISVLNEIVSMWQSMGVEIELKTFSREHLVEDMSHREKGLIEKSPVFIGHDEFTSLVLIKPS